MLNVKISYVVELTPQQFRLVSAALAGKLKDEWKDEAAALQDQLFQERNQKVTNQLGNIAKLREEESSTPLRGT